MNCKRTVGRCWEWKDAVVCPRCSFSSHHDETRIFRLFHQCDVRFLTCVSGLSRSP
jgi:hypothetical protein